MELGRIMNQKYSPTLSIFRSIIRQMFKIHLPIPLRPYRKLTKLNNNMQRKKKSEMLNGRGLQKYIFFFKFKWNKLFIHKLLITHPNLYA